MVLANWVTGTGNGNAWSNYVDRHHKELRNARKEALDDWLWEKGFERIGYTIPHQRQFVLNAGKPDNEYPYHWCLCKSDIWECKECVCKYWNIIRLKKCGNKSVWILKTITKPNLPLNPIPKG